MGVYLSFEKPIESLQLKIEDLKRLSDGEDIDIASEIAKLQKKADSLRDNIFSNLSSWETTQVARHPDRPYTMDYISLIVDDFIEMHGDRCYADDPAIVGGFGRIDQTSLMIIGHQKGRGVKERITRNFGQPQPEGYRKALRLMKTAERFGLPVLTFIDTPGAYPGIGAEERGQAEAIATNLLEMSRLKVPLVAVVIGEGGSGGALALSVTDRLYMLSYSIYSVISPEGCASILWAKDGDLNAEDYSKAADALKLTAQDLKGFEVIDEVIQEPPGGAHRDSAGMAASIKETVLQAFSELGEATGEKLIEDRYNRLRQIGRYIEPRINEESSPQ